MGRAYAGMVDCLDENIGKVVAALEKKGFRENTPMLWILQTSMKSAIPLLPTDEGFYTDDDGDPTPPKIGTTH